MLTTICSDTFYLLRYAPVAPPWKFDIKSALIGAVIAFVLAGLVYRFRKTLRQSWQSAIVPLAKLSQWLRASTEDSYRELVSKRARSLIVPAHAAPLDVVFVEPTLLIPTPPPQSIAEIDPLRASQVLPLRQVLGQHPQLVILGAPGAGKTTLLAYLALACASTAKGGDEAQGTMGVALERMPLYVPLSAMSWDDPDGNAQDDDAQDDDAQDDNAKDDNAKDDNAKDEKEAKKKKLPELGPVDRLVDAAATAVGGNKGMMKILREYLEAQRAIVLVDGWDELLPQQRQLAVTWISESINAMPGNLWLVGAEPRGYAPLAETGFIALKLMTWSAGQVELFAKQWAQVYTPVDSKESAAILRQLTAALRRAARAGARPLELALRAFVHLSGEQTPAERAALFDHVLNSLLRPDKEEETPWVLAACRTVLEQLALDLQQTGRATISREEIEAAVESVLPPPEERPKRATARVFRAMTGKRGLLYPAIADRYTFTHPLWQAYLAAYRLAASDPDDLVERLDNVRWAETLRFYAQVGDMGPLVAAWLRKPDDLFRTRLRTLGSWIGAAPENATWCDGAMAVLARSFLQSKPPVRIQQELAESLAETGMKGVTYLFKQALRHPDAGMRQVAVIGLTMTRTAGDSDLPTLQAALADQDPDVREATVRGLPRLGTDAATRWLARIFMEEDEALSFVAAEALAQCGDEGADFLREAVELEETIARRAAVYGLAQIEARDLLTKVAREDEQWIVRSAATMALDEMEKREKISGVTPLPEIEQLPWLITWAAAKGEGVGLGAAARQMLRRALNEGDAAIRVAAAQMLAQIGRPDDVESLRAALTASNPDVASAALEALNEIGERYALRIE